MIHRLKNLFFCLAAFMVLFICACKTNAPSYCPTEQWKESTPEAQGMDSTRFLKMFAYMEKSRLDIDSILIIRNGYIVLDVSVYPFDSASKHHLFSCTKSVVSTLVGIAIDDGCIHGVEQPVLDFFPDKVFTNINKDKKNLLLKHLLTMSTGLENRDSYLDNYQDLKSMWKSEDWVTYTLDLPMTAPPGEVFDYNNMASFLLSAIIQKTTGTTAKEYAEKKLFTPLGIYDYRWDENPEGITLGYSTLWLHPRDLAKIGFLFINRGKWEHREIVSPGWVAEATKEHIYAGIFQKGYGYQWWIDPDGVFMAMGSFGQYLIVHPEKQLIVVFTSHLKESSFFVPGFLFSHFILSSVSAGKPLAENNQARQDLKTVIKKLQTPPLKEKIQPAAIAALITEKEYILEENDLQIKRITFFFNKDSVFQKYIYEDREEIIEIGPGNHYAYSELSNGTKVACRGNWENRNTFRLYIYFVGYGWQVMPTTCIFTDNKIRITFYDGTSYITVQGESG